MTLLQQIPFRLVVRTCWRTIGVLIFVVTPCCHCFEGSAFLYRVTLVVENIAPPGGPCIGPVWYGVHDGRFDAYNKQTKASRAIQRIAEEGDAEGLREDFNAADGTFVNGIVGTEPICPGEQVRHNFIFNVIGGTDSFISFVSKMEPSNDAFIGNDDPQTYVLVSQRTDSRRFKFRTAMFDGFDVMDAGTEVNDELSQNIAFLGGPRAVDMGEDEDAIIDYHDGYLPEKSGGILDLSDFRNADFNRRNYSLLRIRGSRRREKPKFKRNMNGMSVVPPVSTSANGFSIFRFFKDQSKLFYSLQVNFPDDEIETASLYLGGRGERGQELLQLFTGDDPDVEFLTEFKKRAFLPQGSFPNGITNEEVWLQMLEDNVYVQITSTRFPRGEIRGDLR